MIRTCILINIIAGIYLHPCYFHSQVSITVCASSPCTDENLVCGPSTASVSSGLQMVQALWEAEQIAVHHWSWVLTDPMGHYFTNIPCREEHQNTGFGPNFGKSLVCHKMYSVCCRTLRPNLPISGRVAGRERKKYRALRKLYTSFRAIGEIRIQTELNMVQTEPAEPNF